MGAVLDTAGIVQWKGHGLTQIAPFGETSTNTEREVAGILSTAGCDCRVLPNAQSMLWGKLAINAAINPVTAILGIPNGRLLELPEARVQAFAAAKEAEAVAGALGIPLPYPDVVAAVTDVCHQTAANHSSMLRDVERGRRTEIESITGAVVAAAQHHGIPTPVNAQLLAVVQGLGPKDEGAVEAAGDKPL